MTNRKDLETRFEEKARNVSAFVSRVDTLAQALDYTVDVCVRKEACRLLLAGCEEPLSGGAEGLCDAGRGKTVAAPGLGAEATRLLGRRIAREDVVLVEDTLRNHLAGIDVGITLVDFGIAETGTLVIDSSDEEIRLASMISEIHVALLPVSKIRETAYDVEKELVQDMRRPPNFTAFITGASRTADIERVLALGVHGPLELHILLMEED